MIKNKNSEQISITRIAILRHNLSRYTWHTRKLISAYGWAGITAIVLFFFSTILFLLMIRPLQSNIEALRHNAKEIREQSLKNIESLRKLDPSEQLAAYYNSFPSKKHITDGMAVLFKAAVQQNLSLEQAEYRWIPARKGMLNRYEVVMPVKGTYIQLRKYINQVLAEAPTIALDGMTFNRQKIGESSIDARLRFTLYFGEES